MNDKLSSYIGLSMRAGKLVSGDEGVLKAIRGGEAKLVIIAEDASNNTRKKFTDKCGSYGVPFMEYGKMTELGACIGKSERAVLAVTDIGLANLVRSARQTHGGEDFE
jgi:ribosomal protein L7Ae-like RNA K-turn-binding protein